LKQIRLAEELGIRSEELGIKRDKKAEGGTGSLFLICFPLILVDM